MKNLQIAKVLLLFCVVSGCAEQQFAGRSAQGDATSQSSAKGRTDDHGSRKEEGGFTPQDKDRRGADAGAEADGADGVSGSSADSTSSDVGGFGDTGDETKAEGNDAGNPGVFDGTVFADSHPGQVVYSNFFQSTPEGTHIAGGIACPSPTTFVGSLGDCSGADGVTCYGNLNMCADKRAVTSDPNLQLLVDLKITPEGTHQVGGIPCDTGYQQVGGFPDCGSSYCTGNQLICAKYVRLADLRPGMSVIVDYHNTPEGTHLEGGFGCPAGFNSVGTSADCGLATDDGADCYGNIMFCVKRVPF